MASNVRRNSSGCSAKTLAGTCVVLWALLALFPGVAAKAQSSRDGVTGNLPYRLSISHELADKQKQQAMRDYRHALQALARGQREKAAELLQTSLNAYEDNVSALRLLAVLQIEQQQYAQAITLLKRAVDRYGLDLDMSKLLARAYFSQGDYPAMLAWLQYAVSYIEPDRQFRALEAMALLKTEKFSEAVAAYEQLRQDYPHQGQWWLGLASAHEAQRQFPQAVAIYKQAVSGRVEGGALRAYMQHRLQTLEAYDDE